MKAKGESLARKMEVALLPLFDGFSHNSSQPCSSMDPLLPCGEHNTRRGGMTSSLVEMVTDIRGLRER